jgi:phosphoribosylformylglycinamidine synthase
MYRFYRFDPLTGREQAKLDAAGMALGGVRAETCFLVETSRSLGDADMEKLADLLGAPQKRSSLLEGLVVEVGPRLTFESPLASTLRQVAVSIGITGARRLELFRRYQFSVMFNSQQRLVAAGALHDSMTQALYAQPLDTFNMAMVPGHVRVIPLIEEGFPALQKANDEIAGGLGMTKTTMRWMYGHFVHVLRRNPH